MTKGQQIGIGIGVAIGAAILLIGKAARAAPRDIALSDLDISPGTANPGDTVTISLLATNMSPETLSHEIILGGDFDGVRIVELLPGMSEQVSFGVTAPAEAGTYSVNVNGLSGSFVVVVEEVPPHRILTFDLNVPSAKLGEEFDFSLTLGNVGTAPLSYSVQFALDKDYLVDSAGNRITYEGTLGVGESTTIWQPCVVTEYPGYMYERFGDPWDPLYHNIKATIIYDGEIRRHSQGFILRR